MKPNASSQNDVIVLLPAHNRAETLPSALDAVYDSDLDRGNNLHVMVCANACTDNTLEVLESLKQKHKNLDIVTEWVPGTTRAINTMMDKVERDRTLGANDVVLFLDADAEVQKETISDLTYMLNSNKKLKAVSANTLALPPMTNSLLDHLLFGMSELSLSSIGTQDYPTALMAVRGKDAKGMRIPEEIINHDLWMEMYLGMDNVETHPHAFTIVQTPKSFMGWAERRVQRMMGLYQLEQHFHPKDVKEAYPIGTHKHMHAVARDKELRSQFKQLPSTYKAATLMALPLHTALKAVAWIGFHLMTPSPKNEFKVVGVSPTVQRTPSSPARA